MKALGIIPARAGAIRFPGKPLALLRGRPLVQHVWERATACAALDRVVVATEDERIAAAVRAFGGEAVMTRADHATGTDRCAEVAALPAFNGYGAIVNVQGDEPLIDPTAIASAVTPVAQGDAAMATLAHVETDPSLLARADVVKVVLDRAGDALYFTRAGTLGAGAGLADGFLRHVGLYVYTRETLARLAALPETPLERAERLEQLRALWHGIRIRVVLTPCVSRGVDTEADLAALERDWDTLSGSLTSAPKETR